MPSHLTFKEMDKELKAYVVAYNVLMDHFEELPEESKIEVDKKLSELGL